MGPRFSSYNFSHKIITYLDKMTAKKKKATKMEMNSTSIAHYLMNVRCD